MLEELPEDVADPLARVEEMLGERIRKDRLPELATALGEVIDGGGNI